MMFVRNSQLREKLSLLGGLERYTAASVSHCTM